MPALEVKQEGGAKTQRLLFKPKTSSVRYFPSPIEFYEEVPESAPEAPIKAVRIRQFTYEVKKLLAKKKPTTRPTELSNVRLSELIELANRIFGFNGWQTEIVQNPRQILQNCELRPTKKKVHMDNYFMKLENVKSESPQELPPETKTRMVYLLEMDAVVRLTVHNALTVTGCGHVYVEQKSKILVYAAASKEAITAATKRCFEAILERGSDMF